MQPSNFLILVTCALIVKAADPIITAPIARRSDSCVSLPDGPADSGTDSSLTITGTPASTTTSAPSPLCEHEADPDGAQGLCPNLSDYGWCDCGDAGTYDMLAGDDPCGYTSIPPSGSIALTSTNCVSREAIQTLTAGITVVPITTAITS
ncbi:hypothetical protein MMC10_005823 [Thelotrema lepadinum]|nr:hypothetical protein [Thelotrema lepadinum]